MENAVYLYYKRREVFQRGAAIERKNSAVTPSFFNEYRSLMGEIFYLAKFNGNEL